MSALEPLRVSTFDKCHVLEIVLFGQVIVNREEGKKGRKCFN